MHQEYPNHRPVTYPDKLRGIASMQSNKTGEAYTVNFDTGECDCKHGAAWRWDKRRWTPNSFCPHKLRALSSLVHSTDDDELRDFYETQVGKRYNPFVVISAFHKELRRRDADSAIYWATALIPHRGRHSVISYMHRILFEETRDLELGQYLQKLQTQGTSVTVLDMQRAIRRFCAAPKKWELPWRYEIFLDEMRGYKRLAAVYGYEVAKGKDIIDETETPNLIDTLLLGFSEGDRATMQVGLKGWAKSKSPDCDHMRVDMLNKLTDVLNGEHPNAFDYDDDYAHRLHTLLLARQRSTGIVKYHDLNAFADALSGEPGADPLATLPKTLHKRHTAYPRVQRLTLGEFRAIPLYANDNHTWAGKSLHRTYGPTQLQPGAKQTDIDFRYWGAYGGVAWRYLAYRQHATIDCKWGDVKWKPAWLWGHVEQMNY